MTVFVIYKEERKGGNCFIGPFSTFEKAHEVFLEEALLEEGEEYTEFDSDIKGGKYYDTEVSLEIFKKELQ